MKLSIYLLLTLILYIYLCSNGLGLTPDSYSYIAAAKSFATSYKFSLETENPYIAWTPLFPVLLSVFSQKMMIWVIILHGFALLTIVLIIYKLAEKFIKNDFLKTWVCLQAVFSPYLFLVSAFLWSEIIFIAILWLIIYVISEKLSQNITNKNSYFIILILLSNLLCLQRNVGILFVLGITIWLYLQKINLRSLKTTFKICHSEQSEESELLILTPKRQILRFAGGSPAQNDKTNYKFLYQNLKDLVSIVIYAIFSSISFVIWQIRCELLTPNKVNLTENIFDFQLLDVLYFSAHRLSTWIFPPQVPYVLRIFLFLLLITYTLITVYKLQQKQQLNTSYYFANYYLFPILTFIYTVSMIILLRNFDNDGDRYLAPVHGIFIFCLGLFFDKLILHKIPSQGFKKKVFFAILALFLVYPITRTLKNVYFWHTTNSNKSF